MKKTGIVVVTYNRLDLLREVIGALRQQSYSDSQIVVVNNGSTDGTADWLGQQKDIVTLTQENVGGAGGFFTGMKYVVEHDYSHCWIMDDDVICEPDALLHLHKALSVKENIGFVCSKVVGVDGCPMNTPEVDSRATTNGYADYSDLIQYQMIKVRSATFVSVLFSCDVIKKMGLPYKEFFIWGDDTEYTLRVSNQYDCYMVCNSIVVHKRSIQGSLAFENETNPIRLKNYFFRFRNTTFVHFKYESIYKNRKARLVYFLNLYKKCARLLLQGKFAKAAIIWRACMAAYSFKPQIHYPCEQRRDV